MKLVIHPPVEPERLDQIIAVAGRIEVVNADNEEHALRHMPDADAFFGKITPALLAAAPRLRWVQAPTVSLEHYIFPELAAHPCNFLFQSRARLRHQILVAAIPEFRPVIKSARDAGACRFNGVLADDFRLQRRQVPMPVDGL